MLLGIFPHQIGEKKSLFHIGTGADIRPQIRSRKITVFSLERHFKCAFKSKFPFKIKKTKTHFIPVKLLFEISYGLRILVLKLLFTFGSQSGE
jgi:hypothetical protein